MKQLHSDNFYAVVQRALVRNAHPRLPTEAERTHWAGFITQLKINRYEAFTAASVQINFHYPLPMMGLN